VTSDLDSIAGNTDAGAKIRSRRIPINALITEMFSRPNESEKPIGEQEFWALDLIDWTENYDPRYVVQHACGRWSEADRQFILDELEKERCPLLLDAEERFEARRCAFLKK
jgi:hypothetical protein